MGRTRLSDRELLRGEAFGRVNAGSLSLTEASVLLGLSYRQSKRLMKRYRADGAAGLQHGHCGRVSNKAYAAAFRAKLRYAEIAQRPARAAPARATPLLQAIPGDNPTSKSLLPQPSDTPYQGDISTVAE